MHGITRIGVMLIRGFVAVMAEKRESVICLFLLRRINHGCYILCYG
ncbi:MAG: hypothetical protein [Podoviridae sp. ctQNx1]|nr:MAG: hypothetical protein [Podoviridae sp. ctQNx1]UOF78141.1 hypothetical protein [Caudoviricetes sp.]